MTTSLAMVRRIAARPSIVFEALATAEGIASWWGPEALPVLAAEFDASVGGAYRVRFQTGDGQQHEAFGQVLDIDPPYRLTMSWAYAHGGEPEEAGRTSRLEFVLRAIDGGTELTFTQTDLKNEVSRQNHEHGWAGAFAKLVARLGALTPEG
ncbi:MAG: SRPBCC domain-containing protein [Pseudomonadota bacterium]|jgi:uncharacterized protein YndB with AHSA1/START domain